MTPALPWRNALHRPSLGRSLVLLLCLLLHAIAALALSQITLKVETPLHELPEQALIEVRWLMAPPPPSVTPPESAPNPIAPRTPAATPPVAEAKPTAVLTALAAPGSANDTHSQPAQPVTAPASIVEAPPAPPPAARIEEETVHSAQPDYAYNPKPDYPMLLREQGVGGTVLLRVWAGIDGQPGDILVVKSSGYRLLDDAALRAVRNWRFLPARRGSERLASWVEFAIRFAVTD
ncbi:TonB family protein [Viridibacterium curvum]|uniref:TonB C-terminal domain-containing protein n=1 Tax=Viridibacterium curvum TaxID=1101404 RepID=A0ABP9QMC8_9RHOO